MSSESWTTVRRGRGVPFPDAAASAFGTRRSGETAHKSREFDGPRGFDNAAAEAFGRKKQARGDRVFQERYTAAPKKVVEPEVKLEISNTTLFPALGGAGAGAGAMPKETSCGSSSFADVMKARAEADRAEQEARALEAKRREEERAREMVDLAFHRRTHHRRANYYSGPPEYEENQYQEEEDENSLDYRHPYDTSYSREYGAPMYEEEDCSEHDAHSEEDNSAW